jgi:hypothetical protein
MAYVPMDYRMESSHPAHIESECRLIRPKIGLRSSVSEECNKVWQFLLRGGYETQGCSTLKDSEIDDLRNRLPLS